MPTIYWVLTRMRRGEGSESHRNEGTASSLCGAFVQTPRPSPVLATRSWESADQTTFKRIKGVII